ncbi:MAG: hypothetical protein KDA63_05805, partial [Planctomycetales bacterium]|nr:hypothetical protein [Planctomycetales bacterium]
AYLGTMLAGGLFGVSWASAFYLDSAWSRGGKNPVEFVIVAAYALVIGTFIAGVWAIHIHITSAVVVWALWLPRRSIVVYSFFGSLAGLLATVSTSEMLRDDHTSVLVVTAAVVFGGLGTLASTVWYQRRTEDGRWLHARAQIEPSQFSLASMLWHMSALGALFAFWTAVIHRFFW